jgi:hypothetical protein
MTSGLKIFKSFKSIFMKFFLFEKNIVLFYMVYIIQINK